MCRFFLSTTNGVDVYHECIIFFLVLVHVCFREAAQYPTAGFDKKHRRKVCIYVYLFISLLTKNAICFIWKASEFKPPCACILLQKANKKQTQREGAQLKHKAGEHWSWCDLVLLTRISHNSRRHSQTLMRVDLTQIPVNWKENMCNKRFSNFHEDPTCAPCFFRWTPKTAWL